MEQVFLVRHSAGMPGLKWLSIEQSDRLVGLNTELLTGLHEISCDQCMLRPAAAELAAMAAATSLGYFQ